MARNVTVGQLTASVRMRGDYNEDSSDDYAEDFISSAAMLDFLSSAWAETYDHIVTVDPDRYVSTYELTTSAGTDSYALPDDHYRNLAVDVRLTSGTGDWYPVHRFERGERSLFQTASPSPSLWGSAYIITSTSIQLLPTPTGQSSVRLTYVPTAARLTSSLQTIDGVNGFEEMVVQKALKMCQVRSQEPTNETLMEIRSQEARVDRMASERDRGEPRHLISSRRRWPRRRR